MPIKSPGLVAMETEFLVSLLSLDYLKASQPYGLVQGWYDVLSVPFGDREGNGATMGSFVLLLLVIAAYHVYSVIGMD
ncbi:receptor-like protein kinase [Pyrus ussuriensis x Pyrus communis]|uniref:Receptor-like protein kinase n=1 Tax=Pyrus ussuriensis x Pyrus communis TaxID=2448454 RepID=A0A5N5HLJ3_9ROSA|nr:receptor-like protein kinase [Pyrus ussuriensis x Pyrus communis]